MATLQLPSIVTRSGKRLGRGHGSGRGKTSGRGTKGQKARGTIPPHFEGGQLSIIERLPYIRGKRRNISRQSKPVVIPVDRLNTLPAKTTVTLAVLKKTGIVSENTQDVKILVGKTKLSVALTLALPCSKGVKDMIEKAGGSVTHV